MTIIEKADVFAGQKHVGTLAAYGKKIAFEYSPGWIAEGFAISPFSLPLRKELFVPSDMYNDGLFGVFDDSLPDGWGRLLTDRYLKAKGEDIGNVNQIMRLCMLSSASSGILEYRPRIEDFDLEEAADLEKFFMTAQAVLEETAADPDDVQRLYRYGGSSGGARPKVNVMIDGELWIVKFPSSFDGRSAGVHEYECMKRAEDAGINVAEYKLLESESTDGFFASKRFDRKNGQRIHMISLSGLLESSFRYPSLDYSHLMKVTLLITKSDEEVLEAFRRACFNVFAGNQDDHGKNFAFLYDGDWHLSPAYDITVSSTAYGEHATTVMGKGRDISEDDLRRLADSFSLKESERESIIRDTKKAAAHLS